MTQQNDLLPCPFCGNDACVAQVSERLWLVECRKLACGVTLYGRSKKGVIAKWNTRAIVQGRAPEDYCGIVVVPETGEG